jgi:hypothetical protein
MSKHVSSKTWLWLFLFVVWAVPSLAEMTADTAWVRRYNGSANSTDWVYDLAVDHSGNVYVTGFSDISGTSTDYATIKYYPNGDTAWLRTYNGPANNFDGANAIAVDDSGYVYVTGASEDSTRITDYLTIKYRPNGDTVWVRRYNGPADYSSDIANDLAVDDSGNVYVTGGGDFNINDEDIITIKYYPNGDTAWVRRYNQDNLDRGLVIAVDGSGNVYVTGFSSGNYITVEDYLTIKYLPNGDTAWVRRYDGQRERGDIPYDLAVDNLGNVYVTGLSMGHGNYADYATVKYDPSGTELWVRGCNVLPCTTSFAHALAIDDSNNVYVTGYTCDPSGSGSAYGTIKYYPNGDTVWVRKYGSYAEAVDLALDASGNVYVAGDVAQDYTVIKYNANGDSVWAKSYDGPANGEEQAKAIALDDSGNVYVTGISLGIGTDIDYATIKYVQFLLLRGDANKDGLINSSDIAYLINYLFIHGPAPVPLEAGDVNCDGTTNAADVVYLINYLFIGGPAPGC